MEARKSRLLAHALRRAEAMRTQAHPRWRAVLFPLVGFVSLVWFLVRVVPKPSRAGYPCQRVAAPLASSFVLWLLAMSGAGVALRAARERFKSARAAAGVACLVLGVVGVVWALGTMPQPARADYAPHPSNQPMGVAQGLAPGRVVWVHDPAVTDWPGPDTGTRWYDHVDQEVTGQMLSAALQAYTGVDTDLVAWNALFRYLNGGSGYSAGEKVAIKINLVTTNARMPLVDEEYNQLESDVYGVTFDSIANAPQLLHALLDQLVNVAGVHQSDITIGDPTGLFVNYLYEPLHADFADVHYWDNRGTLGRTRAELGTVPLYWSTPDATGTTQDYLPLAFEQADYIINLAILKSHHGAGITVGAKNHYGSLVRNPDGYMRGKPNTGSPPYNGYYDMHATLPGDGFRGDWSATLMGQYRALVDVMGHEAIADKTVLYLVDGLFGGKHWLSEPSRWDMPPFDGDWPSSLFLSMDPVALDSVARDLLSQQWPEDVLMYEGVEDYLHEAALAGNPPSGTFYDPEGDDTRLQSLGVHEHWNNPVAKQYSRNLGTGNGIELLKVDAELEPVVVVYLPLLLRR